MAEQTLSSEDQRELAGLVAKSLSEGQQPADIAKQLVDSGWEQQAADDFVGSIAQHLANAEQAAQSESGSGGGGMGWLAWIGVLLFINLLSWLFNWPFWVY